MNHRYEVVRGRWSKFVAIITIVMITVHINIDLCAIFYQKYVIIWNTKGTHKKVYFFIQKNVQKSVKIGENQNTSKLLDNVQKEDAFFGMCSLNQTINFSHFQLSYKSGVQNLNFHANINNFHKCVLCIVYHLNPMIYPFSQTPYCLIITCYLTWAWRTWTLQENVLPKAKSHCRS